MNQGELRENPDPLEKPIIYALHVALWPVLMFTDFDLFGLRLR